MNMIVQLSLQGPALQLFDVCTQKWNAGSYGNSVFNFLRGLYTVCCSGCSVLHPCLTLVFFVFLKILAIQIHVRWYLIVVLICISLIICDVDHLFHALIGHLLPGFELGCLFFCRSSVYILDINPMSDTWFVNTFSSKVGVFLLSDGAL